ncbi:calcium-binding allergen Ole e 8-like [Chenopodium quinoa]|uniref:EF-hand domain-containing protein n=1 Tax=Chenopodium quinoa TaxID=63459 RepID=A0A803LV66_CHEQI|nr:calcium-binding allergen Ole e 8-like [Chenopodium quinoa]
MAAITEDKSNSSSSHSLSSVYLSDTAEVKKVFDKFDVNGDGKISADELIGVMKTLGSETSPEEVAQMMEEMDSDRDGFINLEEFADFCSKKVEGDESGSQELHDAFKMYDQDGDDLISAAELHLVLSRLGERCSVEDCEKMIQSVDSDGDGNVSFEEFRKMMTKSKSAAKTVSS